MTTNTECQVCFENKPKDIVICGSCDFSSCKVCCKKYILDGISEAHCMSCKRQWSLSFLVKNFTKSWTTGLKDGQYKFHLQKIVMDREKSLIPETLPIVERKKEEENEMLKLRKEIIDLEYDYSKNTKIERGRIYGRLYELWVNKPLLKEVMEYNYICPCPTDNCRGMISKKTESCGLCNTNICSSCRSIKLDGHKCKQDDLENVELIKKDSRPCPKCAVSIYKIEGCNAMFCTVCKTSFDWRSGKISKVILHNPHAIEWQRTNDIANSLQPTTIYGNCGLPIIRVFDRLTSKQLVIIDRIYMTIGEVDEIIHNSLRHTDKLQSIRIEYLEGKISESRWKSKILNHDRLEARKQALIDIFNTFKNITIDRLRIFGNELRDSKWKQQKKLFDLFLDDIQRITKFINNCFRGEELTLLGNKTKYSIGNNFEFYIGNRRVFSRSSSEEFL